MRLLIILFLSAWVSSCSGSGLSSLDRQFFNWTGKTILRGSQLLSLKQIHLGVIGREKNLTLVRGEIDFVDDLGTYLVIKDDTTKLIVDISQLKISEAKYRRQITGSVEVIGVVDREHRGLPSLKAKGMRKI